MQRTILFPKFNGLSGCECEASCSGRTLFVAEMRPNGQRHDVRHHEYLAEDLPRNLQFHQSKDQSA